MEERQPIQPIESPLQETVDAIAEVKTETKDRTAEFKRMNRIIAGFQRGDLPFALYKTLPLGLKRQYLAAHPSAGRPKTDDEIRAAEKRVAKRRRASKIARQSRRINRAA